MKFKQSEPKEGPWPVPCLVEAITSGKICLYLGPGSERDGPSKETFRCVELTGARAGSYFHDKTIKTHRRVYGTLTFD